MRIGNALFGNANKVGVQIDADIVHPRPDRRHPRRATAHKRIDDRIAGLRDNFQEVRQEGHWFDAKMEISTLILGFVVSRLVRTRFRIDWTKRQDICAQFTFPIRGLVVGKNGRARLSITEGIFGAKSARTPPCYTGLVCTTIGLLAGNDDGLVSGDKARVHLIAQRLCCRQTVRVMPDPDIANFKPGFLQIERKPMRHIRKTKYGNMCAGFQNSK